MQRLRRKSLTKTRHDRRYAPGIFSSSKSNSTKSKRSQLGQATLEYALLLSIAAALSAGLSVAFKSMIDQGIARFNAVLEKELATGDSEGIFPEASQWEN